MNLIKKYLLRLISFYYNLKEKIIIPAYSEKREIILNYKDKYSINILIETGTFLGDTLEVLKNDFNKLYSFELSKELAVKAQNRFAKIKKIKIINEDSGKYLSKLLNEINEPCLFWLDGHYSSEFMLNGEFIKTAKGEKNTPIIEELNSIIKHPIKNHVILIDDARCFNGKNDYPKIFELKKLIFHSKPNASFTVKRDIIRIVLEK